MMTAVACGFLENDDRTLVFHDGGQLKLKKPLTPPLRPMLPGRGMPVPIL
jgi:hypothetical protein